MSDELRVKLLEREGWIYPGSTCLKLEAWDNWIPPKGAKTRKPPELTLDWCHEIEAGLTPEERERYHTKLAIICTHDFYVHKTHWSPHTAFAKATQRATALLAVKGDK